jgi:hypothetical protein
LGNFLWRVFLFVCPGSSLILLLNQKSISIKRKKNNVLHVGWTKSMTKKITEGLA